MYKNMTTSYKIKGDLYCMYWTRIANLILIRLIEMKTLLQH